jgi:serine/threonine-protein kinase RsbT
MTDEIVLWREMRVLIRDESDVVMARKWTRQLALREGLPENAVEALVTAVSEVTRNVLVHAEGGELFLSVMEDGARRGIAARVRDEGPGIQNLEQAMLDGYSSRGGLGLGLSSARRLVNEFRLTSSDGHGTTVILKQWMPLDPKDPT